MKLSKKKLRKIVREEVEKLNEAKINIEYGPDARRDKYGIERAKEAEIYPCDPITVEKVEGYVEDEFTFDVAVKFSNGDHVWYGVNNDRLTGAELNGKHLDPSNSGLMGYIQGAKGSVLGGIINWYGREGYKQS